MIIDDLIKRVRIEIGDPVQPFRTTAEGDGVFTWVDLPKQNIDPTSLYAEIISGAQINPLVLNIDYSVDPQLGQLTLAHPLPDQSLLIVSGNSWAMFTDDELSQYLYESLHMHTYGQYDMERYRDKFGFITYRNMDKELWNFPEIEIPLLVTLCSINVLWALATDLSLDTDIQTAEGTNIDRTARYRQMMEHIAALQERYERYCGQLNVGVFRMETLQLRRTSYTTGRLVPIFKSREFDDNRWPLRLVPQIDSQNEDESGIPTTIWNGVTGL